MIFMWPFGPAESATIRNFWAASGSAVRRPWPRRGFTERKPASTRGRGGLVYCGHTERGSVTRAPDADQQAEVGRVSDTVLVEIQTWND